MKILGGVEPNICIAKSRWKWKILDDWYLWLPVDCCII